MDINSDGSGVEWGSWEPGIRATLMFVVDEGAGRVLLIHKKRGIGAGKINAPGGKIDPGESPVQSAVRECQEELHVTPLDPVKMGELRFVMSDLPDIHCHVFRAARWEGTPTETEEATPLWSPLSEIPYERMWEDDWHWLPHMLAGRKFDARFVFEGEKIRWMGMRFEGAL